MISNIFSYVRKNKWMVPTGILYLIVLWMALSGIFQNVVPFWYDPARDLLSGWDNLSHLTLIGPTSGIPGIFYGPYWIWLLSFGLLFSKNPSIVVLIISVIPYFIIFPYILYRFSKFLDKRILFLMGILLLINFREYSITLWNPYPAPLIEFAALSLILFLDFKKTSKFGLVASALAGFLIGILVNFQISYGIGFLLGTVLYLIIKSWMFRKNWRQFWKQIIFIAGGFIISFLPFIAFELRHNFQQTQTALNALLHYGNVVSIKGLSKKDIMLTFFGRGGRFFSIPAPFDALAGVGFILLGIGLVIKKRAVLKAQSKWLLVFLACISSVVLFIYLTAKNPIWDYHFVGVEILFLLLLAVLFSSFKYGYHVLLVISTVIVFSHVYSYVTGIKNPLNYRSTVVVDINTTQTIIHDAKHTPYSVFVYSSSFYAYDYSYMFRWLADKDVPYRPELVSFSVPVVYLIIPPGTKQSVIDDVLHYRTPDTHWEAVRKWNMPDGTLIIKRKQRLSTQKSAT